MSKRHGAVSVFEYKDQGFLPEGIVNYLGLLGWNPGTEQEEFSLEELVKEFDLARVNNSGAVFDMVKFKSVNQRWMRKLSDAEFVEQGELTAPDTEKLMKAVPLLKERAQTFGEARKMLSGELSCLFGTPELAKEVLLAKTPEGDPGAAKKALESVIPPLNALSEGVLADAVKEALMPLADQNPKEAGGRGAILWPLRYALSGQEKSPDPFTLVSIVGPVEAISRIQKAIAIL
jgi:glutamyl/glutaminyl-tRNA synthetase